MDAKTPTRVVSGFILRIGVLKHLGLLLALFLLAPIFGGCFVMTHNVDSPAVKVPPARLAGDGAVSFSIVAKWSGKDARRMVRWADDTMAPRVTRYLSEEAGIPRVTHVSENPLKGLWCFIRVDRTGGRGPLDSGSGFLWTVTAGIFPHYDHMTYPVTYTLYRDGTKLGDFQYLIHQRIWAHILLLPVGWISLLMDDFDDALIDTTRLFVADARPFLEASQ